MLAPGLAHAEYEPAAKGKSMRNVPFKRYGKIRMGVVGTGGRGRGVMQNFANAGVEIVAICDIDPKALASAQGILARLNLPKADEYGKDPTDFKRMHERDDLDVILIATPWDWHVPMAVDAMKKGMHAFVEVPAAVTLKECWQLVDTSEETQRHCVMLENCNYGYWELMVLNMVKAGKFGDITHGEAAYIHDLRSLLLADYSEGLWRRFPHINRDGNLYPTHGLGPVAFYMDIHRGDRFVSISSMSSKESALTEYRNKTVKDGPKLKEQYKCGDMNTSILRTESGRTVMLQHDVVTPRPYSRHNLIQGTKGCFSDYPPKIFFDGAGSHDWESPDKYKSEFEHELWRANGERARNSGHGGMDFIMAYALVQNMKNGTPPDMDVYDAAAWSAPGPLSDASVAKGGALQRFPDFTRGNWKK